jgi:hypothetical protein
MSNQFPINPFIPVEDQPDLAYALKHIRESALDFLGLVTAEHFRGGKLISRETGKNLFTVEGRALILNVIFGSTAKPDGVYVGIFKNNVTPVAGDTAAARLGASGTYGECQDADYTPETNRPAYTIATTSTADCTNEAARAEFTFLQAISVYGAFLTTTQAKTSTSGALVSAKRFDNYKPVEATDELAVKYEIAATTS